MVETIYNDNPDIETFFIKLQEEYNNKTFNAAEVKYLNENIIDKVFTRKVKNAFDQLLNAKVVITSKKVPFSDDCELLYSQDTISTHYDEDSSWFAPQMKLTYKME